MPKNNTLRKRYDNFIDTYIKPALEYFVKNDDKTRILTECNDKQGQLVAFINNERNTIMTLSSDRIDCDTYTQATNNSSYITIPNGKHHCTTRFHPGSIGDKFLRFIIQQFLDKTNPIILHNSTTYEANELFTVEQLLEKFETLKNRSDFNQINMTNVIENDPVEHCHTSTQNIKSTTTEKAALAESLSSIKSETQNITDALKETGAVSPGSGLMPNQESCYPKPPYFGREEYLVTINGLLGEKLKKFEDQISFKVKEFYTSNIYVGFSRFEITDTAGNTMKVSYLGESKGWNLKVNKENLTFKCNQAQSRSFEIITRYIHDNVYSKKNENGTRVELKSCDTFNKAYFLTLLKEIPNTKGYEYYFRERLSGDESVSKSPSPFNCSFYPIEAAKTSITTTPPCSIIQTSLKLLLDLQSSVQC